MVLSFRVGRGRLFGIAPDIDDVFHYGDLRVMRFPIAVFFVFLSFAVTFAGAPENVKSAKEVEAKVKELLSKMTLDEKLSMIHGCGFNIASVKRLGILPVNMSDASMGLRVTPWPRSKGLEPSTAFPASVLLAATWNPEMAAKYAKSVAEEFRARNMHVLLGPGVNIYRFPLCGRNYEYMGEDPFLAASMVVPYVRSVMGVGVLPVVKHFVANNNENRRKNSNSVVSERALREIYFPAFKAAVVKGGVLGVMNAYSLLNGTYCGEDKWLLKDVLRKEWGFRGMVVSDWDSLWNSELAANSGVDIEMPGGNQTKVMSSEVMKRLLDEGKVSESEIDLKVAELVRPCLMLGFYDDNWRDKSLNKLEEHAEVALETAREGITLLKNDGGMLPLAPEKVSRIVVVGPTAKHTPTTGGGSGGVRPENPVSIWDGMKGIYGNKAEYLSDFDKGKVGAADAVVVCVGLNVGHMPKDYRKEKKKSSIASEQAGFNKRDYIREGEGVDRKNYGLTPSQVELIKKCSVANAKTVVMLVAGGAVDMVPWLDGVKGLVLMYYPGGNGSRAAAEIVAGRVNPSGKLPYTIDKKLSDNAAHADFNLAWNDPKPKKKAGIRKYQDVVYKEGIFLGYRHYDQVGEEPLFPFGFGLSYTSFEYSDLAIKRDGDVVKVSFDLKNTGKRKGAEIAQVYVHDVECSVPRPPKELKGFKKVRLDPGESKRVEITLDGDAFAFWHPEKKKWVVEPGAFDVLVGSSSRDIRLKGGTVK
jgi:beta-glucosidase